MISIWEGKINKIWDAIQFCRIIDNLFFWAHNCLKPKITQYLSQWRLRYCPDVPNIYSLLEKDTRTAEIVHRIQDHLSSLGLSSNEDLPALVRQAVVLQEVVRSSNKEVKVDSAKERKFLQHLYPCLHVAETAVWIPIYLIQQSLDKELIQKFAQKKKEFCIRIAISSLREAKKIPPSLPSCITPTPSNQSRLPNSKHLYLASLVKPKN
jgi:hypothetical protein